MSDKLPEGWTKEFSRSQNRDYYFHNATKTSLWSLEEVQRFLMNQNPNTNVLPVNDDKKEVTVTETTQGHTEKRQKVMGNRVAIVVPFRDLDPKQERQAQLQRFVPYMSAYLSTLPEVEDFKIFIVEQSDDKRKFNRGKLLNLGYKLGKREGFNTFIFHDVDLLPQEPLGIWYSKKPQVGEVVHIARCWSRYNQNDKYLGGIVSFSDADFEAIDGFPNIYWGWGGEDDELSKRVRQARLKLTGPDKGLKNAVVDLEEMSLDEKLAWLRSNRQVKCDIKWECNDAHDEVRSRSDKPKWWGLAGLADEITEIRRDNDRFRKCSIVTVDIGWNFEENGTPHWTNTGKVKAQ
jgi:hypothetical protein